jgi:predicted dehydrogenase
VETDSGATFVAGMSEIVAPPWNDLWTIPGEEHLIEAYREADQQQFDQIEPTRYFHALQIDDFLQAIEEGRPPAVSGAEGRTVVEMFTAIYESNRQRKAIRLPL